MKEFKAIQKFEISKAEVTDFDDKIWNHSKMNKYVQRVWIKFEVNGQVKRHLVYFVHE